MWQAYSFPMDLQSTANRLLFKSCSPANPLKKNVLMPHDNGVTHPGEIPRAALPTNRGLLPPAGTGESAESKFTGPGHLNDPKMSHVRESAAGSSL